MSKKISYTNLLKEALSESTDHTTMKSSMDIKGPMLDPILGYNGGGELQTHKDAASVLERYYFKENDDGKVSVDDGNDDDDDGKVSVDEHVDNDIDEVPGKSDSSVGSIKKQIEKEITTEGGNYDDDCGCGDKAKSDNVEESVIQKLISEMEEDDDEDEESIEEKQYVGDKGAGTEAAGTGDDEDLIPDRSDSTNEDLSMFLEMDKEEEEEEAVEEEPTNEDLSMFLEMDKEEEEEEEEELDVDKKVEEGLEEPSKSDDDDDELNEAFAIFQEEIEADDDDDEDDKEVDSDDITM